MHLMGRVGHRQLLPVLAILTALSVVGYAASGTAKGERSDPSMTKAGIKAGIREGGRVKAPQGTIGILRNIGTAEADTNYTIAAVEAAKRLGLKTIVIDPQGDPQQQLAGAQSLINQGVKAVIYINIATARIKTALDDAAAKGIPFINVGGQAEPHPAIAANYSYDGPGSSNALWRYMKSKLPNDATVGMFTYPPLPSVREREDITRRGMATTNMKIVYTHQMDLSVNLVPDAQRSTTTMFQQNPRIDAVWVGLNNYIPTVMQTFKTLDKCGSVQAYSYDDTSQNLQLVRDGCLTALVTSPIPVSSFQAVDQIAEFIARKWKPSQIPASDPALAKKYRYNFRSGKAIRVVDKTNVPATLKFMPSVYDYRTFFKAKWKTEFGIG